MQTVIIMQTTTPGLTGARKDAGVHNKDMGAVRILILVDGVLSMRPQARGLIGGHWASRGYAVPKLNPKKDGGGPIVIKWQVIRSLLANHLSRRFRAHIQTLWLNVGISAPKPLGVPIRRLVQIMHQQTTSAE